MSKNHYFKFIPFPRSIHSTSSNPSSGKSTPRPPSVRPIPQPNPPIIRPDDQQKRPSSIAQSTASTTTVTNEATVTETQEVVEIDFRKMGGTIGVFGESNFFGRNYGSGIHKILQKKYQNRSRLSSFIFSQFFIFRSF